jgi:hypothetical protein
MAVSTGTVVKATSLAGAIAYPIRWPGRTVDLHQPGRIVIVLAASRAMAIR